MQPATSAEVADGHPLGIPVLKVADFGFARILPAAAMAETLCGSPLYMAPEILRYEKYDAKADLWSVGAVLFEMVAGRPPFRANNHVELLRKIEKGEDRIKFPDETPPKEGEAPPVPVSGDIKSLIRGLLKRQPVYRMNFQDFFACGVWDGWMADEAEGMGSTSYEASTSSSGLEDSGRLREMVKSSEDQQRIQPTRARQPMSANTAMNPQPAPRPTVQRIPSAPSVHRSQPKYYISEDSPPESAPTTKVSPRPISTQERRMSSREKDVSSVEDPQPLTPGTGPGPSIMQTRHRTTEGSPLAATPPLMPSRVKTGKDESALAGSDSLNREYVVVEKGAVEVNKLADGTSQNVRHADGRPGTSFSCTRWSRSSTEYKDVNRHSTCLLIQTRFSHWYITYCDDQSSFGSSVLLTSIRPVVHTAIRHPLGSSSSINVVVASTFYTSVERFPTFKRIYTRVLPLWIFAHFLSGR